MEIIDHYQFASFKYKKNIYTATWKKTCHLGIFPYKTPILKEGLGDSKSAATPWPSGSNLRHIRGFPKGTTHPCASNGCEVTGRSMKKLSFCIVNLIVQNLMACSFVAP
jgi:hypothetical protein